MVSKVAEMDVVDTVDNSGPMADIGNPGKPFVKDVGGFDFISHNHSVALKRQVVKVL